MKRFLATLIAGLLLTSAVFAQTMGQIGGLNVPGGTGGGGSGTVTSVVCPSATITTTGTCNPLPAGASTGQVVTASGSAGAITANAGLLFTGGNSLQIGNGSNAGALFLDTTGGGGVNILAGSSASTFSATLPDNTGTIAELNLAQTWTALQTLTLTNATGLPLTGLNAQATNTIVGNATSGSASPTALAIGSCSGATNALIWTTNSGFGCNTISAGGSPGGSNTQVQYNLSGSFAGNAGLTYTPAGSDQLGLGVQGATTGLLAVFGSAASSGFVLSSDAAGSMKQGQDASTAPAQITHVANVSAGTSNTAGGTWTLEGSQGTGTGVGGAIILQTAPAGTTGSSQNALVTIAKFDGNGHLSYPGTAPAVSSCGTGSPSVAGSDVSGTITIGTTATACTLTFKIAYAAAPHCVLTDRSLLSDLTSYTVGTGTIVMTLTSNTGNLIDYACFGA